MKTLQYYQCEICNAKYEDESDCLECEKRHRIPKNIVSAQYDSIFARGAGSIFPRTIAIEFDNGEVVTYKSEEWENSTSVMMKRRNQHDN